MKTKAAESSNDVSIFKDTGRSEELRSPSASPSTRSSKRKVEFERGSAEQNVEQQRGSSSSLGRVLDHIVGQLHLLTLVSIQ